MQVRFARHTRAGSAPGDAARALPGERRGRRDGCRAGRRRARPAPLGL